MRSSPLIIPLLLLSLMVSGQQAYKGIVTENDSITAMPFVFVIKKSNGQGTMGDAEGKFTIYADPNDTIIFSYVGFVRKHVPVSQFKAGRNGLLQITMTELPYRLRQVNVLAFRIKDYERDYMNDIIDKSRIRAIDYGMSPISALYMRYSREGRQIRKLAKIFEELMIDEQVQKKLSRDIVVKLTGDDKIDYEAFRKYCFYISNDYILSHDGVELYSNVIECYRKYKSELRPQR